jgi:hypothetical protein
MILRPICTGVGLLMVVVFSWVLIPTHLMYADDYAPNSKLWMTSPKPICWSLANLAAYMDQYVIVYDYSRAVGEKLGRPWIMVEQGKCYEHDFSDGAIYVFPKPVTQRTAAILSSPSTYASRENLDDVFPSCAKTDGYCVSDDQPLYVGRWTYWENVGIRGLLEEAYRQDTGITLSGLLPTHYVPSGEGFDGFHSDFGAPYSRTEQFAHDQRTDRMMSIYNTLADGLHQTIEQCDSRQRIEERAELSQSSRAPSGVLGATALSYLSIWPITDVWRLSSGEDVILYGTTTNFARLAALGCTNAARTYLQGNLSNIHELDTLLTQLHDTYSDGTGAVADWLIRDPAELARLTAYVEYGKTPSIGPTRMQVALPLPHVVQNIGAVSTSSESTIGPLDGTSATSTSETGTTSTGTEVPSMPVDTEAALNTGDIVDAQSSDDADGRSGTLLALVYFGIIPLMGIAGLAYLAVRRRNRMLTSNSVNEQNV